MERIKLADGTTWPNPAGAKYQDLMWRLRHGYIDKSEMPQVSEVMEAYSALILHPAFSLEVVKKKVRMIREVGIILSAPPRIDKGGGH